VHPLPAPAPQAAPLPLQPPRSLFASLLAGALPPECAPGGSGGAHAPEGALDATLASALGEAPALFPCAAPSALPPPRRLLTSATLRARDSSEPPKPPKGTLGPGAAPAPKPLAPAARPPSCKVAARQLFDSLRWTEGVPGARRVLRAVAAAGCEGAGPAVLAIGGFIDAGAVEAALQEGFAGVQMARALIREPDLVRRWEAEFAAAAARGGGSGAGGARASPCSHCNFPSILNRPL
jgi:hypothetical protein